MGTRECAWMAQTVAMAGALAVTASTGCGAVADSPDDREALASELPADVEQLWLAEPAVEPDDADLPSAPSGSLVDDPRAIEQLPGFDVTIAVSGQDVTLAWPSQGAGQTYAVWRSTNPYFTPGAGMGTQLTANAGGTSFVDVGANDAGTHYYRVVASGGALSTAVGKQAQPLYAGYTKLGQCLLSQTNTASELAAQLGPDLMSVHVWDEASQSWQWWWNGQGGDLSFGPGEVVVANMAAGGGHHATVGYVPAAGDVSFPLLPGDNLVTTLPPDFGSTTASGLLGSVPHATRVGWWDGATQTTTWYPDDGDFAIPQCSHVHVEVDAPSQWPPAMHDVEIQLTVDNDWTGTFDGTPFTGPNHGNWTAGDTIHFEVPSGSHTIAIQAYDYGVIGGFIGVVRVDGQIVSRTGDGTWTLGNGAPVGVCGNLGIWGSAPNVFYNQGATWIWDDAACSAWHNPSFRLQLEL